MKLIEVAEEITDVNVYVDMIYDKCLPWLKSTNFSKTTEMLIHRGMMSRDDGEKKVRKGRYPMDTDSGVHMVANKWFAENFGHKYRSDAVFVTNSQVQAKRYGHKHLIYPVGDFEVCWSRKYKDMSLEWNRFVGRKLGDEYLLSGDVIAEIVNENEDEWVPEFLEQGRYVKGQLDEYFHGTRYNGHELMVKCDSYLAFSERTSHTIFRALMKRANK